MGVLLGSFTRSLPLQALKIWPNRAVVVYFLADASTRALRSLYRRILASRQGMHQLQPVGDRTQTFTEVRSERSRRAGSSGEELADGRSWVCVRAPTVRAQRYGPSDVTRGRNCVRARERQDVYRPPCVR